MTDTRVSRKRKRANPEAKSCMFTVKSGATEDLYSSPPRIFSRMSMRMLLGLASAMLATASPAHAEHCVFKRLASFPLDGTPGAVPVIVASINDVDKRFIVDIGSSNSGIDAGVADEIGLTSLRPVVGREIYFHGKRVDHFVVAREIRLGRDVAANTGLLHLPKGELPAGVSALIGADLLMNFDVDFDFGSRTLNLYSPEHCKGNVVSSSSPSSKAPERTSATISRAALACAAGTMRRVPPSATDHRAFMAFVFASAM